MSTNDGEDFSFKDYFTPLTTTKVIVGIILIGLMVFSLMLFNGFVDDDTYQIIQNPGIRQLANIPKFFLYSDLGPMIGAYYRPISNTVMALEFSVFTTHPFGYHLVQLILHITVTILLFLLFKKFVSIGISFCLAVVFLVHPLNVESVAYISMTQETLFMLFGLLAVHCVMWPTKHSKRFILLAVFLLLSLLSKETGIIFVILAFIAAVIAKNHKERLAIVTATSASLVLYGLLRLLANIAIDKPAIAPIMTLDLPQRLLHVPLILQYFLSNFLIPHHLIANQSWTITTANLANFFGPLIGMLGIFGIVAMIVVLVYRKHRQYKLPLVLFSGWLMVALGIHTHIIPLDMTVADRWFYAPVAAILGIIGVVASTVSLPKKYLQYVLSIAVIVITLLSIRTMVRITNWKDGLTLARHDIQIVSRDDFLLEKRYGTELMQSGDLPAAADHLQKATTIFPGNSGTWNNLGTIYLRQGDLTRAKEAFQRSIDIDHYFGAYQNLAYLYLKHDDPQLAKSFIQQALIVHPNSGMLWFYLTATELKLQNSSEAVTAAERYYRLSKNQQSQVIYSRLSQGLPVTIDIN